MKRVLLLACLLVALLALGVRAQDAAPPAEGGAPEATPSAAAPPAPPAGAPAPAAPAPAGSASQEQALGSASSMSGMVPDPLSLSAMPPNTDSDITSNTLPPYDILHSQTLVSPTLSDVTSPQLQLDMDARIKQVEDLINRMVWQLNRETSWANSVHEIIQNYQFKYTKVLDSIKQHTETTKKMRDLASKLKKARLHEILENDLGNATAELKELSTSSSETSEDEGSYASLADRVTLMKQDLEKMQTEKVHKILHEVQEGLKEAAAEAVPPPSDDTVKELVGGSESAAS